jgi:AraC family transcriptional regulator
MQARRMPEAITLRDAGRWRGVRLEQWEGFGQEQPEAALPQHAIVLALDAMTGCDVRWAGGRPHVGSFAPSTIAVLPAGLAYSARRGRQLGKPCRKLVLGMSPGFLQSALGTAYAGRELIPRFGDHDRFIEHTLRALADDVRAGYPCDALYGDSLAVALAVHLGRHHSAAPDASLARDAARQRAIRAYIHDQLGEPLALAELAGVAQLELFAFARWFKAAFGVPPHRYVVLARIERAKTLLATSDDSLAQLALACGFSSQSHFAATFRRFVGVSPSAYRDTAK